MEGSGIRVPSTGSLLRSLDSTQKDHSTLNLVMLPGVFVLRTADLHGVPANLAEGRTAQNIEVVNVHSARLVE